MANLGGYTGKILRVDLSTGKITSEDTMKYKDFLGGTGLAYKVLWDEVRPATKAWDPENRLIFGVGPLTGSGSPLSGRVSITSLWPVHPQELPGTGHMGGHWGAELKYAGWDSIIIQGKADKPVWLYIFDDKVELRDASRLWGNGIFRATAEISTEMGSDCHVAAIGQAGENLVRLANIMCDRSHSGGGLGSVMGSKNLKAIGVKGTGSVTIAADKKAWKSLVYEYLALLGANSGGVVPTTPQPWAEYYGNTRWNSREGLMWGAADPPVNVGINSADDLNRIGYRTHKGVMDHGEGPGQAHTVRTGGCQSCPIRCHVYTDVPALEKYGVSRFQGNTCSGNSTGKMWYETLVNGSENAIEVSQLGSALADDYGFWNDYGQIGESFKAAHKQGVVKAHLSKAEYDTIPWKLLDANDPAFLVDLFKRIVYKQGELGKALGEGPAFLAKRWPEMAEIQNKDAAVLAFKMGHAKHHANESSGQVGTLINMMYNRDPMCHTHTNFVGSGLPLNLMKEIGAELFGTPDAIDGNGKYQPMNKGKAVFMRMSLVYMELHNSMTACNYTLPTWASPRKDRKYRGDVTMEARVLSAVTGETITRDQLEQTGLRIFTLFRVLTARQMNEKDMRHKHDFANDWVYDQPADKPAFSPGCNRMDRADMEVAKEMFYAEVGWHKETGMPTKETLEKLNLGFAIQELVQRGLLT
jgi:aldehyde:ferredoxin oxidoreductase